MIAPLRSVQRVDQASSAVLLGLLVGLPALILMPFAVGRPEELVGALVVAGSLAAITVPMVLRIGRSEADARIAELLELAIVAKLAGTLVRYYFSFESVRADAQLYHLEGARLAEHYRDFDFAADIGRRFVGTGFIRSFTGVVYTFTGANRLAGTLVYSALGFWGALLLYRAFCTAVPGGDRRRYAILLFFLPSMLFWPSIIGKEAWMIFGLGLCAVGAAKILQHERGGAVLYFLGLLATAVVRPHLTLMVFVGTAAAWLLRRERRSSGAPARRAIGFVAFLLVGGLLAGQIQTFFGVEDLSGESIEEVLESTSDQSAQGGSQFTPARVRTPLDFPVAAVTVLFRPFVHEATGLTSRIAAAESLVLLGLVVVSLPRLKTIFRSLLSAPYLAMATVFAMTFVFAFAAISNFGILARQRTQALPFFLVLLAVERDVPARVSGRIR